MTNYIAANLIVSAISLFSVHQNLALSKTYRLGELEQDIRDVEKRIQDLLNKAGGDIETLTKLAGIFSQLKLIESALYGVREMREWPLSLPSGVGLAFFSIRMAATLVGPDLSKFLAG